VRQRGDVPSRRSAATLLVWERSPLRPPVYIMFGGGFYGQYDAEGAPADLHYFNDLSLLDPEAYFTWRRLEPNGVLPPPRAVHGAAIVGNTMIIACGLIYLPGDIIEMKYDCWLLRLDTLEWQQGPSLPLPFADHLLAHYGGKLYLAMGGDYRGRGAVDHKSMFRCKLRERLVFPQGFDAMMKT